MKPPTSSFGLVVAAASLRAGDVCAPGSFGPWNTKDAITIVSDPVLCGTYGDVDQYDIGFRVGLGPIVHGALGADVRVAVSRPEKGAA